MRGRRSACRGSRGRRETRTPRRSARPRRATAARGRRTPPRAEGFARARRSNSPGRGGRCGEGARGVAYVDGEETGRIFLQTGAALHSKRPHPAPLPPRAGGEGWRFSRSRGGDELDLDPAFLALVERLVGADRVVEPHAVRQDPRRVELAALHKLEEPRDVAAMVAVAHVDREVLLHRLADREVR